MLVGSVAMIVFVLHQAVETLPFGQKSGENARIVHRPQGVGHFAPRLEDGTEGAICPGVVNDFFVDPVKVLTDQPG